jgi:fatty acyl-CoA reductase
MGKVLVEKLLRSCPGIENIYLLMRPKRGHDINERLNEIINGPLFDILRRERANDLGKIIPIHGDITSEELGISESDQALLCQKVSVVFHSAATVKFDEKLKLSVTINMLGTKRLVELCHRMTRLEVKIRLEPKQHIKHIQFLLQHIFFFYFSFDLSPLRFIFRH